MVSARHLGVCLLAVALLTVGCQAPMADSPAATPAGTPTANDTTRERPAPNITVLNGSLELDPGRVFARVQAVSGTNVTAPRSVRVFNTSDAFYNSTPGGTAGPGVPRFWRVAGLDTAEVNGSALEISKNGYVTGRGDVVVYLGPNSTLADERLLLAHEFTHYVQIQQGQQSSLNEALGGTTTQDGYLRRSIIEGGAVYTTDSYIRAYAPGEELNSPWYDEIQASYPAGHAARFQNGRYIYGADYVSGRLDTPANLSAIYANPPRTAEQLLYGIEPGAESPTALTVETSAGDGWLASGSDTMGEAFVRYALAAHVGERRAERAAAGWGSDSLRIFRPLDGGDPGYVWVIDWDDATNATEFERTLATALDARGTESGGVWLLPDVNTSASLTELGPETTAVAFGSEAFITATSTEKTGETVRVAVSADDAD